MTPYESETTPLAFQNEPSSIPLSLWVEQIQGISRVSNINMLFALVYLSRLIQQYPSLPVCSLNIHRLFLVSVMTASKFLDDVTFKNKDWAVVGRRVFTLHQLQAMEIEFLRFLHFSLYVSTADVAYFLESTLIQQRMAIALVSSEACNVSISTVPHIKGEDDMLSENLRLRTSSNANDEMDISRRKKNSNPLFALTVKIKNENQQLIVYHDDEVESVCEEFCSTHRLPSSAKTALVEQVLATKETFDQKELKENRSVNSMKMNRTRRTGKSTESFATFFDEKRKPERHVNLQATINRLCADNERRVAVQKATRIDPPTNCTFQPNVLKRKGKLSGKFEVRKKHTDGSFGDRLTEEGKKMKARKESRKKEHEAMLLAQEPPRSIVILSTADIQASANKLSAPLRERPTETKLPPEYSFKPKISQPRSKSKQMGQEESDVMKRLMDDAVDRQKRKQEKEKEAMKEHSFHPKPSSSKPRSISPLTLCRTVLRKEKAKEEEGEADNDSDELEVYDAIQGYNGMDYTEIDVVERLMLDAEMKRRKAEYLKMKEFDQATNSPRRQFTGEKATMSLLRQHGDTMEKTLGDDTVPDEALDMTEIEEATIRRKRVLSAKEVMEMTERLHSEREEREKRQIEVEDEAQKKRNEESRKAGHLNKKTEQIVLEKRKERLRVVFDIVVSGMKDIDFEAVDEEPEQEKEEEKLENEENEKQDDTPSEPCTPTQTARNEGLFFTPANTTPRTATIVTKTPTHFESYSPPHSPSTERMGRTQHSTQMDSEQNEGEDEREDGVEGEAEQTRRDESELLNLNLDNLHSLFAVFPPSASLLPHSPSHPSSSLAPSPPFALSPPIWDSLFVLLADPSFAPSPDTSPTRSVSMEWFVSHALAVWAKGRKREWLSCLFDVLEPVQSHAAKDEVREAEKKGTARDELDRTAWMREGKTDTLRTRMGQKGDFEIGTDYASSEPEFEFHPEVSGRTVRLAEKKRREMEEELWECGGMGESEREGGKEGVDVHTRLARWSVVSDERKRKLAERTHALVMADCPFSPVWMTRGNKTHRPTIRVEGDGKRGREEMGGRGEKGKGGEGGSGRKGETTRKVSFATSGQTPRQATTFSDFGKGREGGRKEKKAGDSSLHRLEFREGDEWREGEGTQRALREMELESVLTRIGEQEELL
ncbi:hypothetical protein BLNAU_7708 [Blattamonas nauphoetae]|uniref:Cyclin N-terminal domain-containing protein n=1 Tax=Blattamonas nauphoetae TaxID=2049346 RepID=A0ABQ9Y0R9_9EUKA|nr:hypothetical protein BLNAU_7708 [Blattamonas nauphoetae]